MPDELQADVEDVKITTVTKSKDTPPPMQLTMFSDECLAKLASALYSAGAEDGYRVGKRTLPKNAEDEFTAHCKALKHRLTSRGLALAKRELAHLNALAKLK